MALPPTSQNLLFHILRAYYAVIFAKAADKQAPIPLHLCDFGWEMKEGVPVSATSKGPAGPQALINVIVCSCAAEGKACSTQSCSCHRERVSCTIVCKCVSGDNCHNPYKVEEEEEDDEKMSRLNKRQWNISSGWTLRMNGRMNGSDLGGKHDINYVLELIVQLGTHESVCTYVGLPCQSFINLMAFIWLWPLIVKMTSDCKYCFRNGFAMSNFYGKVLSLTILALLDQKLHFTPCLYAN